MPTPPLGRPAGRHPRRRPVPGAGRPARHDDARRPRRPGDQGRGARHRRRHPRLGPAVRRPRIRRRGPRESTYFLSANRNKESVTLDLKADGRPALLLDLVRRADVLVENFRTGVLDRLGLGFETPARAQPAAGGAVDHRLRARRPRGRPRRLRPDRAGRGRADVADRLRARRPAEGGRADRRPAGRHVRRVRRPRRAARAGAHRRGHGRAHLAARRDRRRARLPGHPVDRRRRGRPRPGQPPRLDRALRAVPLRRRHVQIARGQREACGAGSAPASTSTRPPRARDQPGAGGAPRAG